MIGQFWTTHLDKLRYGIGIMNDFVFLQYIMKLINVVIITIYKQVNNQFYFYRIVFFHFLFI